MSDADGADWPPERDRGPRDLQRQVVEGDVLSRRRITAKEYIRSKGWDEPAKDDLMAFGARAARIAATRKLQGLKRREDGFMVHTWPMDVWDAALRGDEAPARPATQRQIAYLALLHASRGTGNVFLGTLDNLMDEDEAGRQIRALGG